MFIDSSSSPLVTMSSDINAAAFELVPSSLVLEDTHPRSFSPEQVKGKAHRFFLAGRGGETTLHPGNKVVRQRALQHVATYLGLKTSQRGKKFARGVLQDHFGDITFVVRIDYFLNNQAWIAQEKFLSVVKEHGSLETLDNVPGNHYITIGTNWILGILSDIIRFGAAAESKAHKSVNVQKTKKKKRASEPAVVSDNESITSDEERPVKKARRGGSAKKRPYVNKVTSTTIPTLREQVSLAPFNQNEMAELLLLPMPAIEDETWLASGLGFTWIDEELSPLTDSV